MVTSGPAPNLRHYHYRTADGDDVLMLFNEDPVQAIQTALSVALAGPVRRYDAFANQIFSVSSVIEDNRTLIPVDLGPGESHVLLFGDKLTPSESGLQQKHQDSRQPLALTGPWLVSLATATAHPAFTPWRTLTDLINLHAPELLPDFSGTIRYTTEFTLDDPRWTRLDLGVVFEIAEVTLNGTTLPTRIAPLYVVDITGLLRSGANLLTIDVTNTLVNQVQDWFSQFHQLDPTGLLGPVQVV